MTASTSTMAREAAIKSPALEIRKAWGWLTEPHAAVTQPEQRRRARLLAGTLVFLIPLGLIGVVVVPVLTQPGYRPLADPFFLVTMAGEALLATCYGLSRTRHHVIGAALLTVTVWATIFAGAAVATDPLPILMYLGLNVLLASLLLPLRGTLFFGLVNLACVVAFPLIVAKASLVSDVPNAFSFILIMSLLIIVATSMRERDLTRIEQQSRELAEAVQQAEIANKMKDQFLANMSHELRTPLNAIIGFTEVMLMGLAGELNPQAERAAQRIHYNSERLLKLIDDVLDISKIEAGRVEILRRPFEPEELLNTVEMGVRPQAAKKELKLITELDSSLPKKLMGDAKRLEQILLNLVTNAVKFTEQGGVTISLQRQTAEEWAIVVKDTGIGIPPHAQETIFEKFRQIDGTSRRAYGGTGLGLAIVRELALLMDGSVKVKSIPGSGSTFTVTLPVILPEGMKDTWTNPS